MVMNYVKREIMSNILNSKIKHLQNEFIEILHALNSNEDYITIFNSYEMYSKNSLEFIKSKDKSWIYNFFDKIYCMIKKGTTKKELKKELKTKYLNDLMIYHITSTIYDGAVI